MTLQPDIFLSHAQGFARGNLDLLTHDVDTSDGFGNWVLHLKAGVHLGKEELTVIIKKFKGSCSPVSNLPTGVGAALTHFRAQGIRDSRGRRFFQYFLVASLHGAVPVAQNHHFSLGIRKHLELHVSGLLEIALHVNGIVAESRLCFAAGQLPGVKQSGFCMHHAHPFSAPAGGRLDDDRISDIGGRTHDLVRIIR